MPTVPFFGFGSTSDKCIGVAYARMPTRFDLHLSTPRAVADRMYAFGERLREAVTELQGC